MLPLTLLVTHAGAFFSTGRKNAACLFRFLLFLCLMLPSLSVRRLAISKLKIPNVQRVGGERSRRRKRGLEKGFGCCLDV